MERIIHYYVKSYRANVEIELNSVVDPSAVLIFITIYLYFQLPVILLNDKPSVFLLYLP
jgi:hypothetical protein